MASFCIKRVGRPASTQERKLGRSKRENQVSSSNKANVLFFDRKLPNG